MTKRRLFVWKLQKKGFGSTLPFLAVCFFFLLASILALVFAVILTAKNSDDQKFKTTLSSNVILLDYLQMEVEGKSIHTVFIDKIYMGSVPASIEKQVFDIALAQASQNCYVVSGYSFDTQTRDVLLNAGYSNTLKPKTCVDIETTSIVFLPQYIVTIQTANGKSDPIKGVVIS